MPLLELEPTGPFAVGVADVSMYDGPGKLDPKRVSTCAAQAQACMHACMHAVPRAGAFACSLCMHAYMHAYMQASRSWLPPTFPNPRSTAPATTGTCPHPRFRLPLTHSKSHTRNHCQTNNPVPPQPMSR
eukprot:353614-Chlamydomonas_euryale.AAC.5